MKTMQDKIGQMLMVGFEGTTAPNHILEWLYKGQIGGVILFQRNVESPEQLATLTQKIHDTAKYPALVAIDQEGGTVTRMRDKFTESPGAMALSSAVNGVAHTERVSKVLAEEMKTLGINWTYAPVVDISYNAANPTVGTRSFGSDKHRVGELAAAAVRGFQNGGVAACPKHFPGLGNTATDTHLALPALDTPVEELLANDLLPYRETLKADVVSIMTTHTIFNQLDKNHPATLSPIVIKQLLRDELGFEGVVTTDCLEMKAISDNYGAGESAVLAALAGVDIALVSHTREMQQDAYDAMLAAAESGRLPAAVIDRANERISDMKTRFAVTAKSDTNNIKSQKHLEIVREAARASVTLVKQDNSVFPLQTDVHKIALVEFASQRDSNALEREGDTGLAALLRAKAPSINTITLHDESDMEQAHELAASVDVMVLATRNAHLNPQHIAQACDLLAAAKQTILVALRNPFDADPLTEARTILCTCGDAQPSLEAAVDALLGDFVPSGKLPVKLETLS